MKIKLGNGELNFNRPTIGHNTDKIMDNYFNFTITPNIDGLIVYEISGYTIGDTPENFTIIIKDLISEQIN